MRQWKDYLKKITGKKLNNEGSALVTVIVAVMFVTILATTLLYVAGVNYQIKKTDYKNKKSFYNGEQTLENIKGKLMAEVSEAANKAYAEVARDYVSIGEGNLRKEKYQEAFKTELMDSLMTKPDLQGWLSACALGTTPQDANAASASAVAPAFTYEMAAGSLSVSLADPIPANAVVEYTDPSGSTAYSAVLLKGVTLEYTDTQGYTTIITTDFYMQAPDFNWQQTFSDPDASLTEDAWLATPVNVAENVTYVHWEKK